MSSLLTAVFVTAAATPVQRIHSYEGQARQALVGDGVSLAEVARQGIDFPALSQRSLAARWSALSTAEQREFSDLLRQLVELTLTVRSRKLKPDAHRLTDCRAIQRRVDCAVVFADDNARRMNISFRLTKSLRIYDVVVDGTSLLLSYKAQFARLIDRHGFAGLTKRMRQRIDALRQG